MMFSEEASSFFRMLQSLQFQHSFPLLTADDTLLIVTADHSHVFTVGGYPKRGNPIFGLVMNIYDNKPNLGDDGKPYTTLGYANGLGGINGTRENLTGIDTGDKNFLQQATVMRYKETHGLEDVGEFLNLNCS